MKFNYYYYGKLLWHTVRYHDIEALKLLFFPKQFKGFSIPYLKDGNAIEIRNQLFDGFIAKTYLRFHNIQNRQPVIFDLGASYGIISLSFLCQFPDAILYLFEPNPYAVTYIEQLYSLNKGHNVTIIPALVGEASSSHKLYIDRSHFESANTIQPYIVGYEEYNVQSIKLSSFILEHDITRIDFLKMDVEGGEWSILKDIYESKLLSIIKNVAMEVHSFHGCEGQDINEIINKLKTSGFYVRVRATGEDDFQKRYLLWARRGND